VGYWVCNFVQLCKLRFETHFKICVVLLHKSLFIFCFVYVGCGKGKLWQSCEQLLIVCKHGELLQGYATHMFFLS